MLKRVRGGAVNESFDLTKIAWEGLFHAPIAVGCYLGDGTVVFANERMIDLLGHTPEEIEKNGWIQSLYPAPEEQARTQKIVAEVLTREPRRHRRNITRGDGTQRLIDMFSTPFQLDDGRRGVLTVASDMTALPEPLGLVEGAGMSEALESATEALVRIDARTGAIIYASPATERLTGFPPAQLCADEKLVRSLLLPESLGTFDEAFARCVGGEPQWAVLAIERRDGRKVMMHSAFYPVRDASGHVVVVEGVGRDVTAVKELERQLDRTITELRERNEELSSLDRLKSHLLANVSHELRTPLVSIKGYNELLLKGVLGPLTDRQRRGLETARGNIDRLIELIETLLDFAHREEGRLHVKRTRMDLRAAVRDAVGQLGDRVRARGISLEAHLGDESLDVEGDHARLVQVFKALLSNAEKFTEGSGHIRVSARRDGGEVRVAISDEGVGIPAAARDKVFDRFFQVDSSPTRRFGGAGLGLALAREIITQHDGRITIDSTEGHGSTFTIAMPRARETGPLRGDGAGLLLLGSASPEAPRLRALLEAAGFALLEAATPSELVRRARRHRPDAVVLDFPLGGVREAVDALRAEAETHSLPTVAVVAPGERADALDAADLALAPSELARLPARLQRLLGGDEPRPPRRPRVVVVDDEPAILDFTRFMLEREGFDVSCAFSGDAALQAIEARSDLVILDVVLQRSDGIDLCRRIKRSPLTRDVPVLMMTARTDSSVRRESFAAGADGFLLKPFGVDEFLRQVRLHLRDSKMLDSPAPQD